MITKVGIIGTGFGSKVHLPALNAHPDFEVISIAGRNLDKTKKIADEEGINFTVDWRELIDNDNIDLVCITTPPYLHYKMAKKALLNGKHILLEKPTTSTALEARKLSTIAQDNNLIGMIAHEFRWMPPRQLLSKVVKEQVGDIKEVYCNYFNNFASSSEKPTFGWLWDARYDGGMLGAAGSHYVDMIRSTTGLEITELQGRIYTRIKDRKSSDENYAKVSADDGFMMEFEFNNGASGIMAVTTTMASTPSSRFIISGDKGTAYMEGSDIYFAEAGDDFNKLSIPNEFQIDMELASKDVRIPPFLRLLDQLNNSLKSGKNLSPSLVDGWKNQQLLDATRKSHHLNTRISIVDYL